MHRFRFAVRAFAAFVSTALLLASLTAAANAYAGLPNCSDDTGHTAHGNPAGVDGAHAPGEDHHSAEALTPSTDIGCCGTCGHYYDAHLQGLNLATADALSPAPRVDIATPPAHATDFTSRPDLPPPRSASVLHLPAAA